MMIIKENQNFHICLDNLIESKHMKQRQNRMLIENIHKQNIVDIFWVDKGHPNGPEIHVLLSKAIILILNARSSKVCTVLLARAKQISRYYEATEQLPPFELLVYAMNNEVHGWNYI